MTSEEWYEKARIRAYPDSEAMLIHMYYRLKWVLGKIAEDLNISVYEVRNQMSVLGLPLREADKKLGGA